MIHVCSSCQQKNRIPATRLTESGRCGACGHPWEARSTPIDVNVKSFDAITKESSVPILIDFWAAWCGPCRQAAPELKKTATTLAGEALVLKVNTEDHPAIASRFGVRGIPNFVVMHHGKVVRQQAGLVGSPQMVAWLREAAKRG